MTLLTTPTTAVETLASRQARENYERNLRSLRELQPGVARQLEQPGTAVEWVFGRDGALTARTPDDRWWQGCSIPRLAAESMLKSVQLAGSVACFLAPRHAAQLRFTLDRLQPRQAVIALLPEAADLWTILHCDDFTADLSGNRLWFVTGGSWQRDLGQLFEDHPGLATPTQFIRLTNTPQEQVDALVAAAQRIFGDAMTSRSEALRRVREAARPRPGQMTRVCVVAPSQFRLWDDAGQLLREVADGIPGIDRERFDPDDPASSSPLALARAASGCDVLLSANTARSDLPHVVPDGVPWVTWLTVPRVPAPGGPLDRLIVYDPATRDAALAAGWQPARVHVGGWPVVEPGPAPGQPCVAVIADTVELTTPRDVEDFSSHRLVWEAIRDELLRDPFVLHDVHAYLARHLAKLSIDPGSIDSARFIDGLVVPAYQQGVARLLAKEGLPLRLWGAGWERCESLRHLAAGPVRSREMLRDVLGRASAVVHPWPIASSHPLEACGRPILRPLGQRRERFVRDVSLALVSPPRATSSTVGIIPPLDRELLRRVLERNP